VEVIAPYLEALVAQAHPEGGWGYAPEQPAHLEPTCLALLALWLEADQYAAALDYGCQALKRCLGPDGGYRLPRGREEALWPTALVLFVQATLGYSREEVRCTAARLLALQGRVPDDPGMAEMHDIDFRLHGWPWAEGTFAWAEPTAWACLALKRAGFGRHARVAEGVQLLLDRAADEGGINYGNRRVFGRMTEPLMEPTALMVLACQDQADHPRVASAAAYLTQQALASTDLEQLAWARIALAVHPSLPDWATVLAEMDVRLLAAYEERGRRVWVARSPLREALMALALASETKHVFRFAPGEPDDTPDSVGTTRVRSVPWVKRVKTALRGMILDRTGVLRPVPPATAVHIAPVGDYNADLENVLRRQYEHFRPQVSLAGKRIVLKPNLVEYHRDKVINTHPHVVAAAIELCRSEGAREVIVAEGPGHCRNVEYLVEASGLGEVLSHYHVPFVDLNHDEPVRCVNLGRLTGLDCLYLAQTVVAADVVISVAKLKTHHWAGATLSLKNLFGTLPGICYGWPKNELHWRGIDASIVDIALTRTPDLAIIDGIVGMEGDGPLNGMPKFLGALVMGTDLLAVDATCCRLMQLAPERVGYLVLGKQKRLGILEEPAIRQVGEAITALAQPFATLPHLHRLRHVRSA
jgi:uncharacterized protein (DUF362 family)